MAYETKITTSIHGRRLGLAIASTAETGGSRGPNNFLVGPDDFRVEVTTGESTGTNLKAFGISNLAGTSVASTPVYTLDPPIPGVKKGIRFASTDSAIYVKCASGTFISGTSLGSSAAAIRSSGGGYVELMGATTAYWAALNISSTAVNGVALQATT